MLSLLKFGTKIDCVLFLSNHRFDSIDIVNGDSSKSNTSYLDKKLLIYRTSAVACYQQRFSCAQAIFFPDGIFFRFSLPFSRKYRKDKLKAPFYIHWECIFMKIYCLKTLYNFLCWVWTTKSLFDSHSLREKWKELEARDSSKKRCKLCVLSDYHCALWIQKREEGNAVAIF